MKMDFIGDMGRLERNASRKAEARKTAERLSKLTPNELAEAMRLASERGEALPSMPHCKRGA
jgi:hypothetical protein